MHTQNTSIFCSEEGCDLAIRIEFRPRQKGDGFIRNRRHDDTIVHLLNGDKAVGYMTMNKDVLKDLDDGLNKDTKSFFAAGPGGGFSVNSKEGDEDSCVLEFSNADDSDVVSATVSRGFVEGLGVSFKAFADLAAGQRASSPIN